VALAEALTVNKTLRSIILDAEPVTLGTFNKIATFGCQAYEAFSAMLRVNTSINLEFPPFDDASGDQTLVDSRNQMRIELRLNKVGRGKLLSSSQTTKEEWVDALHELSSNEVDDESDAFRLSCVFGLFRLNPEAVSMS
jgi:hypothetical protein